MAVSLVSEPATVQDPLVGYAVQEYTSMLDLLMTGQVRVNHVKRGGEGHGAPDETAHNRQTLQPFPDGPHSVRGDPIAG